MKIFYTLIALVVLGIIFYLIVGGENDTPTLPVDGSAETDSSVERNDTEQTPEDTTIDIDGEATVSDEIEVEGEARSDTTVEPEGAADQADETVIDIDGANFGFSQDEIRVQEGDTVTINFTSTDGMHDWVVEGLDAATERVQTGETTSVTFVADAAGTYEYYCSVGSHREMGMVGTLIVE